MTAITRESWQTKQTSLFLLESVLDKDSAHAGVPPLMIQVAEASTCYVSVDAAELQIFLFAV